MTARPAAGPLLAALLLAVAAVTLLVRLPGAFRSFDDRAGFYASRTPLERETAAADGLDIDNEFVDEVLKLVPPGATFGVAVPPSLDVAQQQYGIAPVTVEALPAYMQDLLLPRREVDPAKADYLLCYACDTAPFDSRMTRLWTSPKGFVIGRLRR